MKVFVYLLMLVLPLSSWTLNLEVFPKHSTHDRPLYIRVEGAKPNETIELRATLIDQSKTVWSSQKAFKADSEGRLDIKDPMELIWSMRAAGSHQMFSIPKGAMPISISAVINGKEVATQEVVRSHLSEDVEIRSISSDGVFGKLFVPKGAKTRSAILVVGGSDGGYSTTKAQGLAMAGFVTFGLAYFGEEGLPKRLEEIPLEYFEKAVQWMQKQPEIDRNRIGIIGTSRGGELALLLASTYPSLFQATVAYLPASHVIASPSAPSKSTWTLNGKPLPFLPVDMPSDFGEAGYDELHPLTTRQWFEKAIDQLNGDEKSAITVEKMKSSLLLISADDDQMWPSDLFSHKVIERLNRFQSPIKRTHLCYPKAGHAIYMPYFPTTSSLYHHARAGIWFSLGGTPEGDAVASEESWKNILEFFKSEL